MSGSRALINTFFVSAQFKSVIFSSSIGIVEIISGPSLDQPTRISLKFIMYNTEIYRHPWKVFD